MARRAKPHEEELPFVALMDTMTNVVGVLIIVLVMIGIGLAKSVQKVLSDLPLVSFETHAQLKEELAVFDAKRDPAEVQAEIERLRPQLTGLLETLSTLEGRTENSPMPLADLGALTKDLEAAHKNRSEKKAAIELLLAQIDELTVKLDTTPRFETPPPVVVRLPSAKPMPERAEIHRILISQNKIVFLNNQELADRVEEELKKDNPEYMIRREVLKGPDGKPLMKKGATGLNVPQKKVYFDADKMEAYFNGLFNKRRPGTRDLHRDLLVEVEQLPNSATIQLKLAPRPESGETVEQALVQTSAFRSRLRELKKAPNTVLWFHVCKDSIPAYLGARDIVDLYEQLPVGWDIFDKPVFTQNMPADYLVDYTPPPPPPMAPGAAPAPKPAGPPPVVIAAPKASID